MTMRLNLQKALRGVRTLHIYLTMMALLLLLFFGATGFMLNHADWFGLEEVRTKTARGALPQKMVDDLDRLAIVEKLRSAFGAQGALDTFEVEPDQLRVVFKRPGSRTEAAIARKDGRLEATSESHGAAAVMTDLHMGHGAGRAWRWVIDVTSLLLLGAALSGLTLWISLPSRRRVGLAALVVGLFASVLTYALLVP
jgi:hypothetical protein